MTNYCNSRLPCLASRLSGRRQLSLHSRGRTSCRSGGVAVQGAHLRMNGEPTCARNAGQD